MSDSSKDFISHLKQTINDSLRLKSIRKKWVVRGGKKDVIFSVPSSASIGFSFEKKPGRFWLFADSPPQNIARMCDGIIAFSFKGAVHIALIELKGAHKGAGKKQIKNAKLVCDFLTALLKAHKLVSPNFRPKYLGLVVYQTRKIPDKNTTTHTSEPPSKQNGLQIKELRNPDENSDLHLRKYHREFS